MAAALPLVALALLGLQSGAPDSVIALRRARDAQGAFERARRALLPYTPPIGGRAEERIGRFRFWHDDGRSSPPPEPVRVREAREQLLAALDSAAASIPGDPWVAGQRVRYLIEHGSPERAVVAARACAAASWWCRALDGLAAHMAGDFGLAEAAFDAALREMPGDRRCGWTDASVLLQGRFRESYRKLDCASRPPLDARLWWLARPLYVLQGDDRRTEHLSRMTMVEIQRDARNAYGIPWGDDMTELVVRYGWPTAWSAEAPRYGGMQDPVIVGHDRTPSFHFVPASEALAEPYATRDEHWSLRATAPRGLYAPAYADSFVALPHQAAAFRRGDSTLVVASYDLSRDRGFGGHPAEVALVLSAGPETEPVIVRSHEPRGVLAATTDRGPALFALEALSRDARWAARARYALPLAPATRVTVSDLLLLEPADSLPSALDQALLHALPSTDLGARRRVVVFWEAYGLEPTGEAVEVALMVQRLGGGLFRRAARALGLAGRSGAVRLAWQESSRTSGRVAARALLLDLSALGSGKYRIELSLDAVEQDPVTVSREIRLGQVSRGALAESRPRR